jgi:alpha-beta hydrolase superfamily lysophospholipase
MTKIQSLLLILLATSLLFSCRDDSPKQEEDHVYFVSITPVNELSLATLKIFAGALGYPELANRMKYGVRTYKFVYRTTLRGEPINASGLFYLPMNMPGAAPIISVQHGTTFIKDDAPSVAGEYTGVELFASAGYIALMPDFIGYGESSDIFHPYYDKEQSALAVIDMIHAAKEYLTQQEIAFSDKLFLTGYSEGGYVTLAAAKTIETGNDTDLNVTAVAAGAGGYDLTGMLSDVTVNNYYSYPAYLAFILMAYNDTYQWNKPLDYFFNQSYADTLAKYMNGQYSGSFINARLTTVADQLLNTEFFERLKTAEGEPELRQALEDNSVSGWNTQIPTKLFHGTSDEVIPYHNSEITLENFIAAGSSDVTLTPIPDGTHGSTFLPMLEVIVPWFEGLK